uniref:Acid phosphatase n=1 Tax=Homalodisca liturata TaxID=320908 RepID=A0A1B6IF36_9HEMI
MATGLFWLSTAVVVVLAVIFTLTNKPGIVDKQKSANPEDYPVRIGTNSTGTRSVPTLQLVTVVTRHGNRAPLFTFPTSPHQWNDPTVWPFGVGELTQSGRVQIYKLGQKVRSLYTGFLDQAYRPEDFKAFSSPLARALQSAELFLAGLFPPTGYQVWNKHLLWQPVPVFPSFFDHNEMVLINENRQCPTFKEAQKESLVEAQTIYNSSLTSFLDYVIPYTGIDEHEVFKDFGFAYRTQILFLVWESLVHAAIHNLTLPDWAASIYPEPITSLVVKFYYATAVGSYDQIKYLEGELYQEIINLMKSKANNTLEPNRRMFYYSGHDYTLMGLLRILGQQAEDLGYINTASALIYELHRHPHSGHFYVQVLFIDGGSPEMDPKEVTIPSYDFSCDFNLMLDITEKYYNITDWQKECNAGQTTMPN